MIAPLMTAEQVFAPTQDQVRQAWKETGERLTLRYGVALDDKRKAFEAECRALFDLGDWLDLGVQTFGHEAAFADAYTITHLAHHTLESIRSVANAIPLDKRMYGVAFWTQAATVQLRDQQRENLLLKTEAEGLTRDDVRAAAAVMKTIQDHDEVILPARRKESSHNSPAGNGTPSEPYPVTISSLADAEAEHEQTLDQGRTMLVGLGADALAVEDWVHERRQAWQRMLRKLGYA
jgi:hypothetical protein